VTVPARPNRLSRSALAGLGILAGFFLLGAGGPHLARYRVTELAGPPLQGPSAGHWLGTDAIGQDVASQFLAGTRTSLAIAVLGGAATLALAVLAGAVAGWLGGAVDTAVMRLADVILVVPAIPLLIVVDAYVRPTLLALGALIAITSWPAPARVVRSHVLVLRRRPHLRAAVGFGASTATVFRRHVLPESGLILVALGVQAAGRAIATEIGLAFLGLATSSGESWGTIMHDALTFSGLFFTRAWTWWLLPPVVAVTMLLVAVVLVGRAADDRVNPRSSRHHAP
jgi:peptide/nickel transport system permease protein